MSTPEEWRAVVGYEGLYEVSDQGRVRSLARTVDRSNGSPQKIHPRVMNQTPTRSDHRSLHLSKGGVSTGWLVHRLVALSFLPEPPEGKPNVLHSNGVPYDNRAHNLRWGCQKDNVRDASDHGTADPWGHKKNPKPNCPSGHPYSGANLYIDTRGRRVCRTCKREWARRNYRYKGVRVE